MISRKSVTFLVMIFPLCLSAGESEKSTQFLKPDLNYKTRLRQLLSYDLNSRFQIGLDRFKVGPLESNFTETKIASGKASRGYGIEFRVKLE